MIVPLFPYEKACKARSCYLDGFFGHFWALKMNPGVMDGCFTTPGGGRGWKNQDCTGNRFQVTVPLLPYEKACKARSCYLDGTEKEPWVMDG